VLAGPIANFVAALGVDGRVVARGSVSEVLAEVEGLQLEAEEADVLSKSERAVEGGKAKEADRMDGKLVVMEEIPEGHVSWSACMPAIFIRLLTRCSPLSQ
jgi:hypothetical protein